MPKSVPAKALPRWIPSALLALTAACGSAATDGSGPGMAALALVPEYPADFAPGTLNLVVDEIRIRAIRPPSEWILDTAVAFPATASSVTVRAQVPLKARVERLEVVLELWAGPLLIFSGSRMLDVAEGAPTGPAPAIPLTYRGPGAETRVIQITPRDTVLRPGQAYSFGVHAGDGNGQPLGDVYVAWSVSQGSGATVTPAGVLTGPPTRGSAMLHARAATGARDSTRIWFAPEPSDIVAHAGGGQRGEVGEAMPAPVVARVFAADGLGVPGIPVRFATGSPGAAVADEVVITDAEGFARTAVTLGTRVGLQFYSATVLGLGNAGYAMVADVGPAAIIHIVRGNGQEAAPGTSVGIPLEVVVTDRFGNPVQGALVRWSVMQGDGILGLTESHSDERGRSLASYRMGPAAVPNFVRATLDLTGTSVVFALRTP